MKTKYAMLAGALAVSVTGLAQEVDDMYFNARDRMLHNESTQAALATVYALSDKQAVNSNPVNPSDTYTGRGVNPEYSAQQKNGAEIVQDNPDYFLSSYKPKDLNTGLSTARSNCACSSPYMSMPYSGFGNPYGSFYSPYGPYYSPYGMMGSGAYTSLGYSMGSYGSMWSLGFGYGMGSMYSPYGMGYGYPGYGYGYPGYGYGYPGYGYGYPGYGYGYGSPYTVVRVVPDVRSVNGRRPDRSGAAGVQPYSAGYVAAGTNGRTRDVGQSRTNYYDPSWRNNPSNFPTRTYTSGGRSDGYNPYSTGRSWNTPDYGSRTRSFDSFGGSRGGSSGFSGGGSSGGGGGGRSRGRN